MFPFQSFEIVNHHDIIVNSSTRKHELFAIARVVERKNPVSFEVGYLFRRAAVNRLRPEIGHTAACVYVN
jgi:hypothetical protein